MIYRLCEVMTLSDNERESLANSAGLTLMYDGSDFFYVFGEFWEKFGSGVPEIISERMFSHMRTDLLPSKSALLAAAASSFAGIAESENVLAHAGYVLSDSIAFDIIVRYNFINYKDEDKCGARTAYINGILEGFGFPPLGTREKSYN